MDKTCFTSYCLHAIKNNKINIIKTYFISYYPYLTINSKINTCYNC